MEILPYEPEWLPQLASLVRVHARLAPPYLDLSDEEIVAGLEHHRYWRFYSPGLADAQLVMAVEGKDLLAVAQCGFVGYGWGYGAADEDGPDWLYNIHCSIFWLFAWPGYAPAQEAAAQLAAWLVRWARREGLPGIEAFRGGPGFLPFGTQLSSHWPHLWSPLRTSGLRQPRDLLVYSGPTAPDELPPAPDVPELVVRARGGRVEAWLSNEPVGICTGHRLGEYAATDPLTDPRLGQWAVVRRLAVETWFGNQGIGTTLLAEQLRRLNARGATQFLLHVPDDVANGPALGLYGKFGRVIDRQQVLRLSF